MSLYFITPEHGKRGNTSATLPLNWIVNQKKHKAKEGRKILRKK